MTMNSETIERAAELLWTTWQEGGLLDALPEAFRPASVPEGFAIQAAITRLSGDSRFGWKIAATSAAGQAHIGVDGPLAGTLLAGRARPCPARFPLGANLMRVAEAEFAFRIGRDLPARAEPYSAEEVLGAVTSLHPAIEVPDSRYRDFARVGAAQLTADNACASWFALGPATDRKWRELDLAQHPVRAYVNGSLAQSGSGANVLGDPRVALTWMANALSRFGTGLAEGEVVTTGTCVKPVVVDEGDTVVADFGPLGRAEVAFDA
ncbi:MAG: fumarylacetoacetate hydrolase family protein [Betaproteobacteria bacterium]